MQFLNWLMSRGGLDLHRASIPVVACLLVSILIPAGCAQRHFLKRSTVSVSELDRLHRRYIVRDVYKEYEDLEDGNAKRAFRDEVVHARMRYVNAHYEVLVRQMQYGRAGKDFFVDAAEITLDAVGSLTGTAATKAMLHAISGGLIGLNASFDRSFYQEQASFVIVQKMDELRDEQIELIEDRLKLPAVPQGSGQSYGFGAAMMDIDRLLRAGSITRALIELSKSAGADAKDAADSRKQAEKNNVIEALKSAHDDD